MVTMEQFKNGIVTYIDKEIADKTQGFKKWILPKIGAGIVLMKLESMIAKYHDELVMLGYISKDGMVDDDRIFRDLSEPARQKGSITEFFEGMGDITFSENDINMLHNYVG